VAGLVQIRNVPEETRRVLKARAAACGKSLNAYLLELINREVARPTVEEIMARAAKRAEPAAASAVDALAAARGERDDELRSSA